MWKSDELKRGAATILVIYKDGNVRGSVSLENIDERVEWLRALEALNGAQKKSNGE